jgi:hypothetical protein
MQGLMDDDDDEIEDNFGINATSGQDGEEAYARRAAMGAYGEDENNDVRISQCYGSLQLLIESFVSFSLIESRRKRKLWPKLLPRASYTR